MASHHPIRYNIVPYCSVFPGNTFERHRADFSSTTFDLMQTKKVKSADGIKGFKPAIYHYTDYAVVSSCYLAFILGRVLVLEILHIKD